MCPALQRMAAAVPLHAKIVGSWLRDSGIRQREVIADWLFMRPHNSSRQWANMYRNHWKDTEFTPLDFIRLVSKRNEVFMQKFCDPEDLAHEVEQLNDDLVRPIAYQLWQSDPSQTAEHNWTRAHQLLGLHAP